MSAATTLDAPRPGPRFVRTATWLYKRVPGYPWRLWRKRILRSAYLQGCANRARDLPGEETDPAIVDTGRALRRQLLDTCARKHAAAGWRVLMLRHSSITADIWFNDLQQCMRHAGIECQALPQDSSRRQVNEAFEQFRPNVFVATEAPAVLQRLDLPFILGYKRAHGCLRLYVPVWHRNAPGGFNVAGHDEWRRALRAQGLSVDAWFSIFEPEFHELFSRDPEGPAVDYASVPQACNPFVDYPLAATRSHDYFMATTMSDERLEVSYRFVRPILGEYRGLWAGPNWGFGRTHIPPAEMALHYAQARVALSPLVGFVNRYGAELTHRVYAAAGCGAFQLTMPTPITGRYFRDDELVQAATPAEYQRLFRHYVDRPAERNGIALAALRRAYGEHTCFHRIDKLVGRWLDWRRRGLF